MFTRFPRKNERAPMLAVVSRARHVGRGGEMQDCKT
jgi:hypothetical protein